MNKLDSIIYDLIDIVNDKLSYETIEDLIKNPEKIESCKELTPLEKEELKEEILSIEQ